MKKVIALLLVSALSIGLFVGCGSKDENATSTTEQVTTSSTVETSAPAEKAKVDILYYWENKDHQKILGDIINNYNGSQAEVEVASEYVPFADFKKQLSIGIAASELPDLVLIDNPDHAAYAAMGLFADVTAQFADLKDQYFEGPWKSCTLDGKLYGIPFGSNDLALFYNKDMFTKTGITTPPTTWDELRADAKKLTGNGVTGLGVSAVKTEEGTFQFLPFVGSTGGSMDKIGDAEGIKALQYYADLIKDGSMSKEVMNWVQSDLLKQFQAGKIAMMVNGPWQVPTLKADSPDLKWDVCLIPKDAQYSSCLGGENWGVVNGDNVDATCKFLKYVVSDEVLTTYIDKFGYFPSKKALAADKKYTDDPVYKVFVEELNYAQPRGPIAKWPELSNVISATIQEVISGGKTPEVAAKDAQAKLDGILK